MAELRLDETALRERIAALARGASLELVDPQKNLAALARLQKGRRIFVAALPQDDPLAAAIPRAIFLQGLGFDAVPHVAVRSYSDLPHLEMALGQLAQAGIDKILLLAGDAKNAGALKDTQRILSDPAHDGCSKG